LNQKMPSKVLNSTIYRVGRPPIAVILLQV